MFLISAFLLFLSNVYVLNRLVDGAVLNGAYRLDLVHYNDFHDRFEETSLPYPICMTNDSNCLGGFPRLYYEVKALLREKPDALLLNAGDTFQGTYWYTLLKWNITQIFINMLPNDVHTIGNHEFDDGVAGLAPYLAALNAPVVCANIDTSNEPALNGLYQPHVVLERKGRKIGIIGLTTPDSVVHFDENAISSIRKNVTLHEKDNVCFNVTLFEGMFDRYIPLNVTDFKNTFTNGKLPIYIIFLTSNPQDVIFLDPLQVAKREAKLLTEKGVDIIIVLSHCGFILDKEIAKNVGENIDIIVGGHSHSLLWNGTAPSGEHVSGPYPVMVETKEKPEHKVVIVQASSATKYLGNLTAYFDVNGELLSFDGTPVFLNRSIPEDPEIKALLEPYKETLHQLVNEVVGYSDEELLDDPCGSRECAIGNIAAESFLNASQIKYKSDLPEVSFLLRNMMRGSIPQGEITRGGVINALPFTNHVVTFVLAGKHLIEAFEVCLKKYWTFKPFNGPFMPHIAGLRMTLNSTAGKVVSASVKEGDGYQTLDPDRNYQVTTLKFLVKGGNGLVILKENARMIKPVGTDANLLEEYIKKVTPLKAVLDNRLTIIS